MAKVDSFSQTNYPLLTTSTTSLRKDKMKLLLTDSGIRNASVQDALVDLLGKSVAEANAWTRLLGLYDQPDLAHAEPDTLRYRLLHLPAKLATHARRKILSIPDTWPWAEAFQLCWQRLSLIPQPTGRQRTPGPCP